MKLLHYSKLRMLTEQTDENGGRKPYRLVYVTKDGEILSEDGVTTTSVEPRRRRRRIAFAGNEGSTSRTIRDCLVMKINDTRIVAS